MSNVPGANSILPSAITNIETISTGVSVPGGIRIASIIGEGSRTEIVLSFAVGGGKDGFGPTYVNASGSDGRHFTLNLAPIVSNRTILFKNGRPLVGTEMSITPTTVFSHKFDYAVDTATGHLLLQQAFLVDQGGNFYTVGATNVGVGTIQNLTLPDLNAPSETWTIKCVSVQRNNLNQPIAGTARFVAFGSVSGNVLDANGNPVIWIANNQTVTNTVLSFSILETSPALREGDYFTIKVSSGVVVRNDTLTATYIAVGDINTPTFFSAMKEIKTKHGAVSLTNTLSLGCQLAFANTTPGILCVQAAPALPRRVSYELESSFPALSTDVKDFVIPLPVGVSPDPDSNIHIFVTNPTTGVETQLLPNKFPFFTLDTGSNPSTSTFVFDNANPPSGNSFSYSVNQSVETLNFATDGYLNRDLSTQINAFFSSAAVGEFDSSYIGKQVVIFDALNNANIGTFPVVAVANGILQIRAEDTPPFSVFVNETSVSFELIDPVFGTVIVGSTGSDGALADIFSTSTATFTSSTVDFSTFGSPAQLETLKLKITASVNGNVGLFDITDATAGSFPTLTISKSFVSEHSLRFEIQDTSLTSDYLVLNHNVVPNGYALRVTIVDVKDASFFDAGWELALASLETQEIDILVPLPTQTISAIFQNALSHCQTMSSPRNKKERVLFIGAIDGLIPANLTGAQLAAVEDIGVLEGIQGDTVAEILAGNTEDLANYSVSAAYGETFRAVYFFPDEIIVQVGSDPQKVSGYYIAAAAAGKLSGVGNVAIPLTNKVLNGFTILTNRQFNETIYEQLAAAGVTTLVPVAGGGNVNWGLTTTQSGFVEEQEISIVFIRDRIAKSMRAGFASFIGVPGTADVQSDMMARALSLMNSFVSQNLITNFKNVTVTQDLVEPRQWNISGSVQPVYPVNWVYIPIGVGVLT